MDRLRLKLYSLNTFVFIWMNEWNQNGQKKRIHPELYIHKNGQQQKAQHTHALPRAPKWHECWPQWVQASEVALDIIIFWHFGPFNQSKAHKSDKCELLLTQIIICKYFWTLKHKQMMNNALHIRIILHAQNVPVSKVLAERMNSEQRAASIERNESFVDHVLFSVKWKRVCFCFGSISLNPRNEMCTQFTWFNFVVSKKTHTMEHQQLPLLCTVRICTALHFVRWNGRKKSVSTPARVQKRVIILLVAVVVLISLLFFFSSAGDAVAFQCWVILFGCAAYLWPQ